MKVFIEDEVFRGPGYHLDLLAVFQLALGGVHRIEVDEDGAGYREWLAERGAQDREECRRAVEFSLELESHRPAKTKIIIAVASSEWEREVPRLTLSDALELLKRPFRILLEDHEADRHFLLCMANEQQRRFLEDAARAGVVRFEHGGGLESMNRLVQEAMRSEPSARLTSWLVFDSDALRPGEPSDESAKLQATCGRKIPHHQLRRRAIENYLTRKALQGWTYNDPRGREARVGVFEAFYRMSDAQRHHYNMKNGFVGKDGKRGDSVRRKQSAGDLYGNLSQADRSALGGGFDAKIAGLFNDGSVEERDLAAEGALAEMGPVLNDLIARIR
ncbi:MAG TPA: hypothetical protein VLS89_05670 [Candidatus Nanopelagicales bacterium]|nr:hypothetical protein [Candidatus Nanopelagicales bacterium]